MTPLAPLLAAFLLQRLPLERGVGPHTRESYAYALKLLVEFASRRLKVAPSALPLEALDAPLILAFLAHLETDRQNRPSSRNARLAALKSFMRLVEHRVPSALDQIRGVLAIPSKKCATRLVPHLSRGETQALLDAPDPTTRAGIRDRPMLLLGVTGGLRVSELVGLRLDDVISQSGLSLRIRGKGRRERQLPLAKETAAALRAWLAVRRTAAAPELFLNARG